MDRIGFIGQGWIGKNLADHFEERGFAVVRYSLEPRYVKNKDAIGECDVVFIAVPTPTTQKGFDDSIIRDALKLVGSGKVAVIKSTMLPGTTDKLQKAYSEILVLHAPEFLRETSVRTDIDYPDRNIVGIPSYLFEDKNAHAQARNVMNILPNAPYKSICTATEAEMTKHGGNNFLYLKVVFANILYEMAHATGARYDVVAANLAADPRIGGSHLEAVHQLSHLNGTTEGRGAGGHCFIKDFAAFREFYEQLGEDELGVELLRAVEEKNKALLSMSGKDRALLESVYGAQEETRAAKVLSSNRGNEKV